MTQGIGVAKKLNNGTVFKELPLYLRLPVVVQLLHGITALTESGDQVSLDSIT